MKSFTSKCLSFVLAITLLFSALNISSTGIAFAAASDKGNVIRIIVDDNTFKNYYIEGYDQIYCMIYDETADEDVTSWMSNKAKMTRIGDTETWSYDLDAHGITLDPAHRYTVIFNSGSAMTDELVIDNYDPAKDYTAVFTELYTHEAFTEFAKYQYKWIGENEFDVGMDIIRISTDPNCFWEPTEMLYCHIVDETANEDVIEMGRMTQEDDPDLWSFDLGKHGAVLDPEHTYSVIFHDGRAQTEPIEISSYDRAVDYTAHYNGKTVVWSADYSFIYGDADCDGEVTILDVTVIQRVLADYVVDGFNEKAADVDGGGVDITDATMIQRFLAEIIDRFPLENQST